jgi:hypothetical protein
VLRGWARKVYSYFNRKATCCCTDCVLSDDIVGMMSARRMGRPPKGEKYVELVRVTYRLEPETVKALKKGARKKKLTQTEYVELAVRTLLIQDGIIQPKKEDV